MCVCVCVSHSHGSAVNWIVLPVCPGGQQLVLHQVEQRVTHLLLVHPDDGVSHGEHLHHVGCDPATRGGGRPVTTVSFLMFVHVTGGATMCLHPASCRGGKSHHSFCRPAGSRNLKAGDAG